MAPQLLLVLLVLLVLLLLIYFPLVPPSPWPAPVLLPAQVISLLTSPFLFTSHHFRRTLCVETIMAFYGSQRFFSSFHFFVGFVLSAPCLRSCSFSPQRSGHCGNLVVFQWNQMQKSGGFTCQLYPCWSSHCSGTVGSLPGNCGDLVRAAQQQERNGPGLPLSLLSRITYFILLLPAIIPD